ncbi:hypothetical protein [Actinomadura miaoliensis]|uniref:Uncharacterized protein n=1 Tax=Actinomadura miaoliensis TaxID=430685 RepID=A0ABP7WAT6_9ACTN
MHRARSHRRINRLRQALHQRDAEIHERDAEIERLRLLVQALGGKRHVDTPPPAELTAALHTMTASGQSAVWVPVRDGEPPVLCIVQGGQPDPLAETRIWHWVLENYPTDIDADATATPLQVTFQRENLPSRLLAAVLPGATAMYSSSLTGIHARQVRDSARRAYRARYRSIPVWGLVTGPLLLALRDVERFVSVVPGLAAPAAASVGTAATAAATVYILGLQPPSPGTVPKAEPSATVTPLSPTAPLPTPLRSKPVGDPAEQRESDDPEPEGPEPTQHETDERHPNRNDATATKRPAPLNPSATASPEPAPSNQPQPEPTTTPPSFPPGEDPARLPSEPGHQISPSPGNSDLQPYRTPYASDPSGHRTRSRPHAPGRHPTTSALHDPRTTKPLRFNHRPA